MNWFQFLSAMFGESLENTKLLSHPWIIDPLWMFKFPEKKLQHSRNFKQTNKTSLDTLEWVRGIA